MSKANGPLAQMAEHLTLNQGVAGSIPAWPTTCTKGYRVFEFLTSGKNSGFAANPLPMGQRKLAGVVSLLVLEWLYIYWSWLCCSAGPFSFSRPFNVAAAASSSPGVKWLYKSKVMVMEECPSRSCTTLG
jgi:hypothetical protein